MLLADGSRQDLVLSRWISMLILACISAAVVAFGGFSAVAAGIATFLFCIFLFLVAVLTFFLVVRRRNMTYRR